MSISPSRPVRAAATAAAVLLLVAACGGASASPAPSTAPTPAPTPAATATPIPPTPAPTATPAPVAARLLEVTASGGFINPAASIGALPTVVVDTDGRIYTAGVAADGSSPLVPIVSARDTGAAGAAAILAAIKAAKLDKEGAAGGGVVADTGATVFSVMIDGVEVVNRIAGGTGPGGPGKPGGGVGGPGASGAPGAAAMDLLAKLQDPATTWGATTAATVTAYAPTAYRVFIAPSDATAASLPNAPIPWPLATAPDGFGSPAAANLGVTGLRSGVVMGADAALLAKAVAGAQPGTSFIAGKAIWQTWIRPLLPDELGN